MHKRYFFRLLVAISLIATITLHGCQFGWNNNPSSGVQRPSAQQVDVDQALKDFGLTPEEIKSLRQEAGVPSPSSRPSNKPSDKSSNGDPVNSTSVGGDGTDESIIPEDQPDVEPEEPSDPADDKWVYLRDLPGGSDFEPKLITDFESLPDDYVFEAGDYELPVRLERVPQAAQVFTSGADTPLVVLLDGNGMWNQRSDALFMRVLVSSKLPEIGMVQFRVLDATQAENFSKPTITERPKVAANPPSARLATTTTVPQATLVSYRQWNPGSGSVQGESVAQATDEIIIGPKAGDPPPSIIIGPKRDQQPTIIIGPKDGKPASPQKGAPPTVGVNVPRGKGTTTKKAVAMSTTLYGRLMAFLESVGKTIRSADVADMAEKVGRYGYRYGKAGAFIGGGVTGLVLYSIHELTIGAVEDMALDYTIDTVVDWYNEYGTAPAEEIWTQDGIATISEELDEHESKRRDRCKQENNTWFRVIGHYTLCVGPSKNNTTKPGSYEYETEVVEHNDGIPQKMTKVFTRGRAGIYSIAPLPTETPTVLLKAAK